MTRSLRRVSVPVLASVIALCAGGVRTTAIAQAEPAVVARNVRAPEWSASAWGQELWNSARKGDGALFERLLAAARDGDVALLPESVMRSAGAMLEHLAQREKLRNEEITKANEELEKHLGQEATISTMVKAMRHALEIQMLTPEGERARVVSQPRVAELISKAEDAARRAEEEGRILDATELYAWLDALHDQSAKFRPQVRRLGRRQEMLRLYVPRRLWELNNERRTANGDKELPAYNALNDDFAEKVSSISTNTVLAAVMRARQHVEQTPVPRMIESGLENVRTMLTTEDLGLAFDGLRNGAARDRMLATVSRLQDDARAMGAQMDDASIARQLSRSLETLLEENRATVRIMDGALLHEFGNGAMSALDEYTQIIWPDEVRRFDKNTQGHFVGVGVQIEHDQFMNVRVVTPIEGTPAQAAGIESDDIITKVNGKTIFGLTLDGVVDLITGREGTKVVLTIERTIKDPSEEQRARAVAAGKDPNEPIKEEIEFAITRATINVATVKGWKRQGVKEDAWDWFVDGESGIGYVRLTQFADDTVGELDRALAVMQAKGLKGLVLDLRYNPGGLLDQAVYVAQRLLPYDNMPVVKARSSGGVVETVGYTNGSRARLANVPIVVLTNEGSASASEIVSGAVSVYSRGHVEGNTKAPPVDALVLGWRTFGKGSVQNVWHLTRDTKMKVTTAYYMLPDNSIIHRRPGQTTWGVEPHMKVEMLPDQNSESLRIRRNADVLPIHSRGADGSEKLETRANPDDLLSKGVDLQLEAAKVLLQARAAASSQRVADDSRRPQNTREP